MSASSKTPCDGCGAPNATATVASVSLCDSCAKLPNVLTFDDDEDDE